MSRLEAVSNKRLASPDGHCCLIRFPPALTMQSHGAGAAKSLNEIWTDYRKELEFTIHKEKTKDHEVAAPDLLSQEGRLRKRLGKLNMDMDACQGDGNCLVSCLYSCCAPHGAAELARRCCCKSFCWSLWATIDVSMGFGATSVC